MLISWNQKTMPQQVATRPRRTAALIYSFAKTQEAQTPLLALEVLLFDYNLYQLLTG